MTEFWRWVCIILRIHGGQSFVTLLASFYRWGSGKTGGKLPMNGDSGKVMIVLKRQGMKDDTKFCSEAFRVTKGIPSVNFHLSLKVLYPTVSHLLFVCTTFTWHWIEGLSESIKVKIRVWLPERESYFN